MTFKTTADGSASVQWEATLPKTATANTIVRTLLTFAISVGYSEEAIVRAMGNVCDEYDMHKEDVDSPIERVVV